MKVFLTPNNTQIDDANGLGKVIHAQYKYLGEFGIEFVNHPEDADIVAAHVIGDHLPRVDIAHFHGAYFSDPGSQPLEQWMTDINRRVAATARKAMAVTIPSEWAGMFLKRDMRITPHVIPNGVDLGLWEGYHSNGHYVLWNKNRVDSTVDPQAAYELAKRGVTVVSTYPPGDIPRHALPASMKVTGRVPFAEMVNLVKSADVYLATTKEVMSLSVLEALAAGVPVLGYNFGGTAEVVRHKVEGYLAEPGDIDGLMSGLEWIRGNRDACSKAARERAKEYGWKAIIEKYAELYRDVYQRKAQSHETVACIITSYNYANYVTQAVNSALVQTHKPDEIIVVDDGSTDDTAEVLRDYSEKGLIRLIRQDNSGVANARNAGIKATNADYIICLDADDKLHPLYVETLLPALKQDRGLGVVWSKLQLFNDTGEQQGVWDFNFKWEEQAHTGPQGQIQNGIPAGAMFRREMWERAGGFKQVYHPAEDAEFWLRGLSLGFTARRVTDEPLFYYREHEGSASRTKPVPPIHIWHPWSVDKQYPFAAPVSQGQPMPPIRSYSQPLVSVIIPVGPGHAKWLPGALDSLLGQTFRDWEAIVVDDTGDSIAEALKPYPFVKVVATSGKRGAGKARNDGLKEAKAPLCLLLDADDYLMPEALERMVRVWVADRGQRYIYTDWVKVEPGHATEAHESYEYDQRAWLRGSLHPVTVLMQTEDARRLGFDEKLSGYEDWDFFIKAASQGVCGKRLGDKLLGYRIYSGQRRENAEKKKASLIKKLETKYGRVQLMACGCGSKTETIVNQAQEALDPLAAPKQADKVMLEFIGEEIGSIPFIVNGRTYRGANNPREKYVLAHKDDVARLTSLGKWRIADSALVAAGAR